jgi:integrase
MSRSAGVSTPSYRRHKPSGQAVVTIEGRDFYLGRYGTKQSRREYDRLIGEWFANGRRVARTAGSDLTISELLVDYLRFAARYYREGNELANIKCSVRQLKRLYGDTRANDFGPLALKAVREAMITDDLCRNEINKRVRHIHRAFKWGVENERISPVVFQALKAVGGLRRGRSAARESAPVKPVPEAYVDAVKPHVSRQVWAMIELQRLTGMRPGEVVIIRGCDLTTSDKVWTYTPEKHMTMIGGLISRKSRTFRIPLR